MKRCTRCFVVRVALIAAVLALFAQAALNANQCSKLGGIYIPSIFGFYCIEAKELK